MSQLSAAACPASRPPTASARSSRTPRSWCWRPPTASVAACAPPRSVGWCVDVGAEAMLNRRPEAVSLAHEVGLGADIVHPATTSAHLWNRGRLVADAAHADGRPARPARSRRRHLRQGPRSRCHGHACFPPTELGDRDISVGDLVEERLGKEIVDRLVEPLLGGVYAGHSREISARAAVPQLVALLERDRSLTPGRRRGDCRRPTRTRQPRCSPASAGEWAACPGRSRQRPAPLCGRAPRCATWPAGPDGGWNLVVGSTRDPEVVQADAVVLATPARATARLLSDVAPAAALAAGADRVRLDGDRHPGLSRPRVPRGRRLRVPGAAGRRAGRSRPRPSPSPSGTGSATQGPAVGRRCCCFAARWVGTARSRRCRSATRSSSSSPCATSPTPSGSRHGRSTATSSAGAARCRSTPWGTSTGSPSVRRELGSLPGLAVCGSAYDGIGIPACIASAGLAAAKVVRDLDHEWSHDQHRQEGSRAQRHHPLHDVVRLQPARGAG